VAPSSVLVYTSLFTTTKTVLGGPSATATLWTSGLGMAPLMVFQVSPPSELQRAPSTSMPIQTLRRFTGSIAMPVTRGMPTFGHSSAMAACFSSQLLPPSVERKTVARHGVPVPANMISGLSRSMVMAQTAYGLSGDSICFQLAPASSLQYSPLSVPA
jgi:hypothetical protein